MINLLQNRRHRPTIWTFSRISEWWDTIVPGFTHTHTHTQWVHNFRMSEETFICLCAKLCPAMEKHDTNFRVSIPLKKRVPSHYRSWQPTATIEVLASGHLFGVRKKLCVGVCMSSARPLANDLFQNRFVFLTSRSLKKWQL